MEPFLSEIRMFSHGIQPRGWAACDGRLLQISRNQALFSLLGTTYGGDGRTTFALPDLRGRVPVHFGEGVGLGERSGAETHTLTTAEMPEHSHEAKANNDQGGSANPAGQVWGQANGSYSANAGEPVAMSAATVGQSGNSQPHENRAPYLTVNLCIAVQGIFPSQN